MTPTTTLELEAYYLELCSYAQEEPRLDVLQAFRAAGDSLSLAKRVRCLEHLAETVNNARDDLDAASLLPVLDALREAGYGDPRVLPRGRWPQNHLTPGLSPRNNGDAAPQNSDDNRRVGLQRESTPSASSPARPPLPD